VLEEEVLDRLEVVGGALGRRGGRRLLVVSTSGHANGAADGHEGGAEPPPRCIHGGVLLIGMLPAASRGGRLRSP
jgi:hypothetical protein